MSELILDGHKLLYHLDRVQAWLKGERIAPITIDCALTRRCNYSCVYCYSKLQTNDEKRITKDIIFRFLDDATEIGVKAVSFVSDGESTCSPYFTEAILRGHNNGLDLAVGTNGYLLTTEILSKILPALTYLRFNFSGSDPVSYSKIMGCKPECFDRVCQVIKQAVRIKKRNKLKVTLGLQMVLLPEYVGQIIPLSKLGQKLGVDYTIIKHCSDNQNGQLGVNYEKYLLYQDIFKKAESLSTEKHLVKVKWSKILAGNTKSYDHCYGPLFLMQLSGSGLVAPCGMLFNSQYKKYHIGNIVDKSFKEIWKSKRYWEVMGLLASDKFNPHTMCAHLCIQHKINEFLWNLKKIPEHKNFV